MKTYGLLATQTLVSLPLDEQGEPIFDSIAPSPRPDDWTPPAVVPLVKIDKPADTGTHTSEPILVWFDDRVERQWQPVPIPAAELRSAARTNLRAAWDSLPAYIRGPFQDKFNAANALLDAGDDEAAKALIEYAEAPMAYSVEQVAMFSAVKAQMASGIAGLPN